MNDASSHMASFNLSFVKKVYIFDSGYLVWETTSWFGNSDLSRQVVSYLRSTNIETWNGAWLKVFQNRWSLLPVVSQTR